jgi:hypothetical protein
MDSCKGPHTRSNKFAPQRVVQETVSIHDTVSLRKLQSLGKCHNENLSKAVCLAIILAYAAEEETVYRKRKRSMWTKDWLKRRSVFGHNSLIKDLQLYSPLDYKIYLRMCPSAFGELLGLFRPLHRKKIPIWGKQCHRSRWRGTTARKYVHIRFKLLHNLIVEHQNSNLLENHQTVAQTVKPHHTRSNSLRHSLCCANCLTVCGALDVLSRGQVSRCGSTSIFTVKLLLLTV